MKIVTCLLLLLLFFQAPLTANDRLGTVELKPIESYPAQVTVGGVTIAATPYSTDEESAAVFDVRNLNSRGYFPVHVVIKNGTKSFLTISTRNVLLFTPDGEQLYSTPAAIVVDNVTRAGLSRREPTQQSGELDVLIKRKVSPLMDFSSKELISASLEPGATLDGFLFFSANIGSSTSKSKSKSKNNRNQVRNLLAGSSLYIPRVEEEGTRKPIGPFTIRLDQALNILPTGNGKE